MSGIDIERLAELREDGGLDAGADRPRDRAGSAIYNRLLTLARHQSAGDGE